MCIRAQPACMFVHHTCTILKNKFIFEKYYSKFDILYGQNTKKKTITIRQLNINNTTKNAIKIAVLRSANSH